jgi:hypothetical protein
MEEARLNGFQLAVEMAVGAVVISEKQATNNILVRDQIMKHSGGYVDDFKIIEQSGTSLRYTIVMDVKVRSSQIADVLLNTGTKKGTLDSARIYAQYESYNKERNDAEKVINNLLTGYPRNAFNTTIKSTKIRINNDRNMVVDISAEVTWNNKWVNSLVENLSRVSDKDKTTSNKISVVRKPSQFSIFDEKLQLYINDDIIYRKTSNTIFTQLFTIVEVVDAYGDAIIRGCGDYSGFDAIGEVATFTTNASYTIPKNSRTFENMKNMDHVNVYVDSTRAACLGKV